MFSFPKCFLSSSIHFYFILTISLRYNRHTVFKVYSLIGSDMKLIWQPMCWPYLSPPKLPCAPLWLLPPCHPLPQTTTHTFVSRLYRLLFHFLELYTSVIINMYFCGGKVDVHSSQLVWDSFLFLFFFFFIPVAVSMVHSFLLLHGIPCADKPKFSYPHTHSWTFVLFPVWGYSKYSWYEYWCTNLRRDIHIFLLLGKCLGM